MDRKHGVNGRVPAPIKKLIDYCERSRPRTSSEVARVLRTLRLDKSAISPWTRFDHDPADSYGRALVHQGERFEIMVMSWCAGDMAAPHDHGRAEWGAVRVFGRPEHAVFANRRGRLVTVDRQVLRPDVVLSLDRGVIHQMGNGSDSPFASLHVYGRTDRPGPATEASRVFNLHLQRVEVTNGGAFFDLPPGRIDQTIRPLRGDVPSALRYRAELANRRLLAGRRQDAEPTASLLESVFGAEARSVLVDFIARNRHNRTHLDRLAAELRAIDRMRTRWREWGLWLSDGAALSAHLVA